MPYTLIDAIKDEANLLGELAKWAKRNNKTITESIYEVQRASLLHIAARMQGYDYAIAVDKDGKEYLDRSKSDRKTLEEEYPALKKAAEQYDIIEKLIDSTPD